MVKANHRFYELIGYTPEEFNREKGSGLLKLFLESNKERAHRYTATAQNGQRGSEEGVLIHRSGELLDVLFAAEWTVQNGELFLYTTIVDITALKQVERKNRELLKDYQMVVDNSLSGLVKLQMCADGVTPVLIGKGFLKITQMT